jgi:ubiquinone/menaquinone biosynthesis C-methylase UbiE
MTDLFNEAELEQKVKGVYRDVAERPGGDFHFEMGRDLAEQLGYSPSDLDAIPEQAVESFAGVGYHFDLAALEEGDDVIDLGSGSGTDVFVAAVHVGASGSVTGLDMTEEQLEKARLLRDEADISNVQFKQGKIENLPFEDNSFDVVISNGVINLSPAKPRVFEEVSRVLRTGGRFVISDINSESEMPESIKADPDLWAACVGGACPTDYYRRNLEELSFADITIRENPEYEFISEQAKNACEKYGIRSVSLLAHKA